MKFFIDTANIDEIKDSEPPDDIKKRQTYESKHGTSYYEADKNNITDEVELKEWMGWYDISENPDKPDFQPIIAVLANDSVLCRVEKINLPTKKKILIFPMRPMRQANSLIGKSPGQVVKNLQKLLNQAMSLGMDNFKLLVKLLFKYKKGGSVDFDELFARGGNAIGWDDDPDDITIFNVPNMQNVAFLLINMVIQFMQQTTGAVDYLMGTSAGRGVTETATGIENITEQALFKFGMMANNVYTDLKDFVNYIIVLYHKYGGKKVIKRHPKLKPFFKTDIRDIENSYIMDIGMKDLAQRRDVERAQFINAINIIGGLLQNTGGNMKELLKQVMERFDMENIDKILAPDPALKKQMEEQAGMIAALKEAATGGTPTPEQTRGGSPQAVPQAAQSGVTPAEIAREVNA